MKNELKKKLLSLCVSKALEFNSNDSNFFSECLVNNKTFSFNINKFSTKWIKIYKEDFVHSLENEFNELIFKKNQYISFNEYITLKYFYLWILPDFFEILPYLPPPSNISGILNIGAGIGYLDIILSKLYSSNSLNYYLVEKKSSKNEKHYDGSDHLMVSNFNPLSLLKNNFMENDIKNAFFYEPEMFKKSIKSLFSKINLVISIRSYCYLYDIDEYYEVLKTVCRGDSLFILDVNFTHADEFKRKFKVLKVISSYKTHDRLLAYLK